jgi:hypothetical protein
VYYIPYYRLVGVMLLRSVVFIFLLFSFEDVISVQINSARSSYLTNQDLYACTTREDCCLKAQATLRSMISTTATYDQTTKTGTAIYSKCNRGWNYDPVTTNCTKTVPFEPLMVQPSFSSLSDCLSVTTSNTVNGNYLQRQKECLRPFWMVHEECIYRTFNNCLKQSGRCSSATFSDWLTSTIVETQYQD